MERKNDLGFVAPGRILVIGKYQSTVNENMSVRLLDDFLEKNNSYHNGFDYMND